MLISQGIWCSTLSRAHPTNELFTGGSYAGYLVTSVYGATVCHYATGSYALGPRLSLEAVCSVALGPLPAAAWLGGRYADLAGFYLTLAMRHHLELKGFECTTHRPSANWA